MLLSACLSMTNVSTCAQVVRMRLHLRLYLCVCLCLHLYLCTVVSTYLITYVCEKLSVYVCIFICDRCIYMHESCACAFTSVPVRALVHWPVPSTDCIYICTQMHLHIHLWLCTYIYDTSMTHLHLYLWLICTYIYDSSAPTSMTHLHLHLWLCVYLYTDASTSVTSLIERKKNPPGGFPIYYGP